jgi:hypothetical protein
MEPGYHNTHTRTHTLTVHLENLRQEAGGRSPIMIVNGLLLLFWDCTYQGLEGEAKALTPPLKSAFGFY